MRRILTFPCEGNICAATLDETPGGTGILLVTGGREPRIGAHGWQAALAGSLREAGHPVLRFDRRGVGDSGGEDRGYGASGPDIAAAARCLRQEASEVRHLIGIGNCDAATALAMFHRDASLAGMILLNPWLGGSDEDDLPPAAAIRRRYRERLASPRAWLRLATGRIDLRAAMRGLRKVATPPAAPTLAGRIAAGIADIPAHVIVSQGDATGVAFARAWGAPGIGETCRHVSVSTLPTRSHSFAGEGDHDRLVAACLAAIHAIERV